MYPVIPYIGGKFWAARRLATHMPTDYTVYVDPFFGGGNPYWHVQPLRAIISDVDPDIINIYRHVRDAPEEMSKILSIMEWNRETYDACIAGYYDQSDLVRAVWHIYLRKTTYGGKPPLEAPGYYERRMGRTTIKSLPCQWANRYIRPQSALLRSAAILCCDFEAVIDSAPDGAFIFCDPPYNVPAFKSYYTHRFEPDDHVRLANCLRRNDGRVSWMLTHSDTPAYRDMYDWADIREESWIHQMKVSNGVVAPPVTELVIVGRADGS